MRIRDLINLLKTVDPDTTIMFGECDHISLDISGLRFTGNIAELVSDGWTDDCGCEHRVEL